MIAALVVAAAALLGPAQPTEPYVVIHVAQPAWQAEGAAVAALSVTSEQAVPPAADGTPAPTVAAALAGRPPGRYLLLSLPKPGHLGGVALYPGSGVLRGSTRRDGLVTLADVHRHLDGVRPLVAVPGAASDVAELARREHLHRPYHGIYMTGLIALPLLLYIAVGLRRRIGPRARAVGLVLAAYPAAGFVGSLLPWWRLSAAWVAAVVGVALATVAVAGLGVLAGRLLRAPAEVGVAAVTAVVFVGDLVTGGYLQETGIASYSAIAGGRFYGLGNVGFAVLATAACVALGAAATRYGAAAWLGLVPVVAAVALPAWGADFGGAVTLTAVLVAALAVRARRVAVVLGAAGGLVVALAVAALDYRRADPSHLGRFVGEVLHGGWTDTIGRKAGAAAASAATFYPLLVVGSAAAASVLLRGRRPPEAMVRALLVLWVLGSLVNDSGVMVAAAGLAVAVPLLLSYPEART